MALAAYDESLVHLTYSVDKAAGEEAVRNAIAHGRASGSLPRGLHSPWGSEPSRCPECGGY